jgi:hypothetical protein
MATIGNNNPTLADVAKRSDPDGKIDSIVEILNETNEVLDDMTFLEGNLETGNKTTIRSGLPTATWRKLNYGVQPSKSQTVQVIDSCGMLEAYAEVDKALADLNGNSAAFRLSEDRSFLEAMNQEMANTLIYGDTDTDPEKFMGLEPRFNDNSGPANADNIIAGGGSGSDNCSIWLVVWGPNTIHGIFPKGSVAGFQHKDLGEVTLEDAASGKYQGYRTHYKWDIGLCVRDWRYVVRIANVDTSDLANDKGGSSADLTDLMIQALELVPNLGMGRPVFYVNRTIRSMLRRQILATSNVNLTLEDFAGKRVVTFDGVPVRRCDALLATEATVS